MIILRKYGFKLVDPSSCDFLIMSNLEAKTSNNDVKVEEYTWENFENWIHCICIVNFDLELGQALEVLVHLCNLNLNSTFREYTHDM